MTIRPEWPPGDCGMNFIFKFASCATLALLAGCSSYEKELKVAAFDETKKTAFVKSPTMAKAQLMFGDGHYGKAAKLYEKEVESAAKNPEAWLGLAASYDQIRRYELADRAYAQVIRLVGTPPSVLNNMGYSMMLRGKLEKSRQKLQTAYAGDPANPYIIANIELLNKRLIKIGKPPVVFSG